MIRALLSTYGRDATARMCGSTITICITCCRLSFEYGNIVDTWNMISCPSYIVYAEYSPVMSPIDGANKQRKQMIDIIRLVIGIKCARPAEVTFYVQSSTVFVPSFQPNPIAQKRYKLIKFLTAGFYK